MSHRPTIPQITIDSSETPYSEQSPQTDDHQSPASLTLNPSHQRNPSDPQYLAPGASSTPRQSQDEPASPTNSISSSVRFHTSVDLRHNQPDAHSGVGSFSLLSPNETSPKHGRKNSNASLISAEGTEPDHNAQSPSSATSMTIVSPTPDHKGRFPHRQGTDPGAKSDDEEDSAKPPERTDVEDPTPFAFRPKLLAELVDPKSIPHLKDIGGPYALVKGLGTDQHKGLSPHALGQVEVSDEKSGGEGPYAATIADRQRVYGVNVIPVRKSKSLLQLMWIALQDKVLVCGHFMAISPVLIARFRYFCALLL